MRLTGKEQSDFNKVIRAAILQPSRLQMVTDYYFSEDDTEDTYISISQGESDYCVAVYQIVRWANSQDRVLDLLLAVLHANPSSLDLADFIDRNLQRLLTISGKEVLPPESIQILVDHLRTFDIARTKNFEAVIQCCRQACHSFEQDSREIWKGLNLKQLSAPAKWLLILRFLLDMDERNEDNRYVWSFVKHLSEFPQLNDQCSQSLTDWLDQEKVKFSDNKFVPDIPTKKQEVITRVRGYCVVYVEILRSQSQLYCRSQIHIQKEQNNEFTHHISRFLDNFAVELPVKHLLENNTQAVCQSPFLNKAFLKEIIRHLTTSINQSIKQLQRECSTVLRQKFYSPPYELIVEFCLPKSLLVESVDLWEIETTFGGEESPSLIQVGREYKVVIRSRDRIEDRELFNKLITVWSREKNLIYGNPSSAPEKWENRVTILNIDDFLKEGDRNTLALRYHNYLGVALTCPLCLADHEQARDKWLDVFLEAGVPVLVWSRDHQLENLDGQLKYFLEQKCFYDFDILLKRAFEKRVKVDEAPLSRHLAVWCDEPQRIQALYDLFVSKGRLGW